LLVKSAVLIIRLLDLPLGSWYVRLVDYWIIRKSKTI